jgi:hypothetical protein
MEANVLRNLVRNGSVTINGLMGLRYADLQEDVNLIGRTSNLVPALDNGGVAFLNNENFYNGTVTSYDRFRTRNQFWGGQVGARAEMAFGNFFAALAGTVALGSTHEVLQISGLSTLQATSGAHFIPWIGNVPLAPPYPTTAPGGTLALPSNIGRYTRDRFSVLPEIEVQLGYALTQWIRCFVGYNFMYWSNVARPGAQIDRVVDIAQIPTFEIYDPTLRSTAPAPHFRSSGFWAQGLTFGVQLTF